MTVALTALKFAVALVSGSVGVLSEAIHSLLDLVSAALSFFTVRHAVKPADQDHPFGHGKFETLSSLFEAVLLVVAAGLIIKEGIEQIQNPRPLAHEGLAMAVILVSLVVSYFAYIHNQRAAHETDSSALHVNALHFLSDVVASGGVLFGLILIKITGVQLLDPIIAFAVALYILAISVKQVWHALMELADKQLPESEIERIRAILASCHDQTIEVHDLRTRKSGSARHVDFHLVVCGRLTVDQSHEICDLMERRIHLEMPGTSVNIHVEPCEADRKTCPPAAIEVCHVLWKERE